MSGSSMFPSASGPRPDARRFARAPVSLSVTCTSGDGEPSACEASDIGGGGIRLEMPSEMAPGSLLLLRFRLPGVQREIVARGKAVMSFYDGRKAAFMHGIAFTQIDPNDQQAIVRFVEGAIAR